MVLLIIEDNFFEEVSTIESLKQNREISDIPLFPKLPVDLTDNIQKIFDAGATGIIAVNSISHRLLFLLHPGM